MLRQVSKLNALAAKSLTKPGKYSDGFGLYLQISKQGHRSWVFRYMLSGRARAMGLGPVTLVSLSEARLKAIDCRKLLLEGQDPLEIKGQRRRKQILEVAKTVTFDECAASFIDLKKTEWGERGKSEEQWRNSLKNYVSPVIGKLPIQSIDTALVLKVLEPIWRQKTETAKRLQGRLENILDWAKAREYRIGENPAQWNGHLDKLLPAPSAVKQVQHHAALPYNQMGTFISKLQTQVGVGALAMEFLILTASRTSEVLEARWSEIDHEEKIWTIPAGRMKAKREHRVPLSSRAFKILEQIRELQCNEFIFPGSKKGRPLSNVSLLALLGRMEYEVTSHGFRSTFRTWAAECTNFPREVAEQALAHTLKDKVEAAYQRGDLIKKRQALLNAWANFCAITQTRDAKVTHLPNPARMEMVAIKVSS